MCPELNRSHFSRRLLSQHELKSGLRRPRGNNMKITPALLLCGAVLILAAPVWADRIDLDNESPTAKFSAESTPAAAFTGRFEPNITFGARDAKAPIVLSAFSSSSSSTDVHPFNLREFDSRELAFIFSRDEKTRREEREGNRNNVVPKLEGSITSLPISVSEPGSISFLLAGLAAVGFWMRRRQGFLACRNNANGAPRFLRTVF